MSAGLLLEVLLEGAFVATGVDPAVVADVWGWETVEGVTSRAFLLGAIVVVYLLSSLGVLELNEATKASRVLQRQANFKGRGA